MVSKDSIHEGPSPRLQVRSWGVGLLVLTFLAAGAAIADDDFELPGGPFESQVVQEFPSGRQCTSPFAFCTSGRLDGAVAGTFEFTVTDQTFSRDFSVLFFRGESIIETDDGDTITATDVGAINLPPLGDGSFVNQINRFIDRHSANIITK